MVRKSTTDSLNPVLHLWAGVPPASWEPLAAVALKPLGWTNNWCYNALVHVAERLTNFLISQDIRIFFSGLTVHVGSKLLFFKSFFQTLISFLRIT